MKIQNLGTKTTLGLLLLVGIGSLFIEIDSTDISNPVLVEEVQSSSVPKGMLKCVANRVVDGDTVNITCAQGNTLVPTDFEVSVRLCGADTVEKRQQGGEESSQLNRTLLSLSNGEVLLNAINKDRYDRIVGEVFVDTQQGLVDIGLAQIEAGYALVLDEYYRDCSNGEALRQASDFSLKNGIYKAPQTPQEFRRGE